MLLGFKTRFAPMILDGSKRHTIRAKRKIAPKPGEICHCYTGLRQKGAKLLGRWPCLRVEDITIKGASDLYSGIFIGELTIDGHTLSDDEQETLATHDGFASFAEMMEFWRGRLPFSGDIIHWDFDHPAKVTPKGKAR
jgi:hypothetical protein